MALRSKKTETSLNQMQAMPSTASMAEFLDTENTHAHDAARNGHVDVLQSLHDLSPGVLGARMRDEIGLRRS